jgi:hypothetical protein
VALLLKESLLPHLANYQDVEAEVPEAEEGQPPLEAEAIIHNTLVRFEAIMLQLAKSKRYKEAEVFKDIIELLFEFLRSPGSVKVHVFSTRHRNRLRHRTRRNTTRPMTHTHPQHIIPRPRTGACAGACQADEHRLRRNRNRKRGRRQVDGLPLPQDRTVPAQDEHRIYTHPPTPLRHQSSN